MVLIKSIQKGERIFRTVGTQNKGQLIFSENGSNKGIFEIPLFAIFKESRQIRDFQDGIQTKWHFLTIKLPY